MLFIEGIATQVGLKASLQTTGYLIRFNISDFQMLREPHQPIFFLIEIREYIERALRSCGISGHG